MKSIILVVCVFSVLKALGANLQEWENEVKSSVARNLHGKCHVFESQAPAFQAPRNSSLALVRQYPSPQEIAEFRNVSSIYTKGRLNITHPNVVRKLQRWKTLVGKLKFQILPEHPGQNIMKTMTAVQLLANGSISKFYEDFKMGKRTSYLLLGSNGFIHPYGFVGFSCGYFQGREGCSTKYNEGKVWYSQCTKFISENSLSWKDLWNEEINNVSYTGKRKVSYSSFTHSCFKNMKEIQHYKRVFLATALWDDNYAHFIMDSLSRIARYLPYLRENPDVKIHIKGDGNPPGCVMFRKMMFTMMNINPKRLVDGPVLADEVIIPRALTCSYALYNPFEFRLAGKALLAGAKRNVEKRVEKGLPVTDYNLTNSKVLILMQRDRNSEKSKLGRVWSDVKTKQIMEALSKSYKDHQIVKLRSNDAKRKDHCPSCELLLFTKADVLIGTHGAGLTNMLLMPPGSLIVEVSIDLEGITSPYSGYIGMQCAATGQNHYLYSYERYGKEHLDPKELAEGSYQFYTELQKKNFTYVTI